MMHFDHLDWPFFEPRHREFARALDAWASEALADLPHEGDVDATCRRLVRALGDGGWLRHCVALQSGDAIDTRAICLARDILARHHGLAGCDMGACALLPRLIGQGRASELLYTGRAMAGEEALAWGFLNRLAAPEALERDALAWAAELAEGPSFGHAMTKRMLHQEWDMGVDQAIESEAQAQAICMATQDFQRAYTAFAAKQKPAFEGD